MMASDAGSDVGKPLGSLALVPVPSSVKSMPDDVHSSCGEQTDLEPKVIGSVAAGSAIFQTKCSVKTCETMVLRQPSKLLV